MSNTANFRYCLIAIIAAVVILGLSEIAHAELQTLSFGGNCTSCEDGIACNQTNSANRTCICFGSNSDGSFRFCGYGRGPDSGRPSGRDNRGGAPGGRGPSSGRSDEDDESENCTSCDDGTGCDQTNSNNRTCICSGNNPDGTYRFCGYGRGPSGKRPGGRNESENCTSCTDGTACNQTNSDNKTCSCFGQNADGTFRFCGYGRGPDSKKPGGRGPDGNRSGGRNESENCTSCEDGTLCNQTNSANRTCTCMGQNTDGTFRFCNIMKKPPGPRSCSICNNQTSCGATSNNHTCVCISIFGGENQICRMMNFDVNKPKFSYNLGEFISLVIDRITSRFNR